MLEQLLAPLTHFVVATISALSYPGVVALMAIESFCIPLPSEVIMPFSGYLVYLGRFGIWQVSLAGAFGCLLGSWGAYGLGYLGGERVVLAFIRRWGRFVLISEHEYQQATRLFKKYGSAIAFFSRLLPAVRTYISLPAGIAKMPFLKFSVYTFIGSFIWSYALATVGYKLGENWRRLGPIFHRLDAVLVGGAVVLGGIFLFRRLSRRGEG